MSRNQTKAEGSVKQEHIVDAAIKRFSHFGINKTTLAEIADDTGISKPSLFYYFADKSDLLEAVGRRIINEFVEGFEAVLTSAISVEKGLSEFLLVKRSFFKKYLLLALQADSVEMNKMSPQLLKTIVQARKRTELLLADLLSSGVGCKELRPVDVSKTSKLILETLEAFEYAIKYKSSLIELKDIDVLFDKEQEVVQLLLNGLKTNEWKN
jgi:AcrR family transcriptional regulator